MATTHYQILIGTSSGGSSPRLINPSSGDEIRSAGPKTSESTPTNIAPLPAQYLCLDFSYGHKKCLVAGHMQDEAFAGASCHGQRLFLRFFLRLRHLFKPHGSHPARLWVHLFHECHECTVGRYWSGHTILYAMIIAIHATARPR
jgi:hypothetical protein